MNLIKPCPVCGKKPNIIRDYNYEDSMYGAWCTIQCKPFFYKPHLKVEAGKAGWERALICAIKQWNKSVDEYNQKQDCSTCKYGNYNDHYDIYCCYYDGDCKDWEKWELK